MNPWVNVAFLVQIPARDRLEAPIPGRLPSVLWNMKWNDPQSRYQCGFKNPTEIWSGPRISINVLIKFPGTDIVIEPLGMGRASMWEWVARFVVPKDKDSR